MKSATVKITNSAVKQRGREKKGPPDIVPKCFYQKGPKWCSVLSIGVIGKSALNISHFLQPTCKVPPLGPHPVQKSSWKTQRRPQTLWCVPKILVSLPNVCFQAFWSSRNENVFSGDAGPRGTKTVLGAVFWEGDATKHFSVKKRGFSVKGREWFSEPWGFVRISTGKAIHWRGLGHSVNCRTLKIEKLLSTSSSRKSALMSQRQLCIKTRPLSETKFLDDFWGPLPLPAPLFHCWPTSQKIPNIFPWKP